MDGCGARKPNENGAMAAVNAENAGMLGFAYGGSMAGDAKALGGIEKGEMPPAGDGDGKRDGDGDGARPPPAPSPLATLPPAGDFAAFAGCLDDGP